MVIYKLEDRFDRKSGKVTGTEMVYDKTLCDFTGKEERWASDLGSSYSVDYNDHDECFGCREDEYKLGRKYKFDVHTLFNSPFTFDEQSYNSGHAEKSILIEMLETHEKETGEKVEFLDQLFRWARVRMVGKLLAEKKYTLAELGIDASDEEE